MSKQKLHELCQQHSWRLPEYTTSRVGPDHNPRFSATITVNGIPFLSTKYMYRSSKEAENKAALLAYDHFISSGTIIQSPNAALPDPSNVHLHLYKNRLQSYAQKRNLALPVYSSVSNGPHHARRFESKVTVGGITYDAPNSFSTLKEAEKAAAKVAFEAFLRDDVQEDEGYYKSLLQDLAIFMRFRSPEYQTIKSGQSHIPVFSSTVEIADVIFQGQEASSKKQAEINAAKIAYAGLIEGEGKAKRHGTEGLTNFHTIGASVASTSNLESTVINDVLPNTMLVPNEMQLNIKANAHLSNGDGPLETGLTTEKGTAFCHDSDTIGDSLASSSSRQTNVTIELQHPALPIPYVSNVMEQHVKPMGNPLVKPEHAEQSKVVPDVPKRRRSPSDGERPIEKGGKYESKKADTKLAVKKEAAAWKAKKGKGAKDPNMPKRAASAFFVFMEDFRKSYKEKHPSIKSVGDIGKAGGSAWNSMVDADKAPYQAKADKRKKEYEKQMKVYNKTLAEGGRSKVEDDEDDEDGSDEL